jgi:hypothetical protein
MQEAKARLSELLHELIPADECVKEAVDDKQGLL